MENKLGGSPRQPCLGKSRFVIGEITDYASLLIQCSLYIGTSQVTLVYAHVLCCQLQQHKGEVLVHFLNLSCW